MNFESDDEIQAYFNQLNKSAHDLQYAESSSDGISPPSQIPSMSEISEKKVLNKNNPIRDKLKSMEDKYLKKSTKKEAAKVSLSLSQDYLGEDEKISEEEHRLESTDIDKTDSSGYMKSGLSLEDLAVRLPKKQSSSTELDKQGRSNFKIRDVEVTKTDDGTDNAFPSKHLRRKSSTASLLMAKDGVFYSSSISTDIKAPPKRKNSVIKFSKYVISNDSASIQTDSIQTEEAESVEEEISHVSRKSSKSSLILDKTPKGSSARDVQKQAHKKSPKESSSNEAEVSKSSSETKEDRRTPEAKKTETETKSDKGPTPNGKTTKQKRRKSNKKRRSKERESSVSSSLSSLSSSSSSSFSVKIKRKKKNRRKTHNEKKLTKLICKVLRENLPFILRESAMTGGVPSNFGLARGGFAHPLIASTSCCEHSCTSWRVTNSRIDDALRQTIDLTRQFLESHKAFTELETQRANSTYQYTFLKAK